MDSSTASRATSASATDPSPEEMKEYERLKALAAKMFKEKQYKYAIKHYDAACAFIYSEGDTNPTRLSSYLTCKNNAAQCCINLGDYKGAIKFSTHVLSKDPQNVKALYRHILSFMNLEQSKKGLEELQTILKIESVDIEKFKLMLQKMATNLLVFAINNHNFNNIERLIPFGAYINYIEEINNSENAENYSCLYGASYQGRINVVEFFLSKGIDINVKSSDGVSSLMIASQNGHLNIVELLLSKGANVNDTSNDGISSLMVASQNGHFSIVELLLSNGANVNHISNDNSSSLMVASQNGHFSIVELLLSNEANVNDTNNDGGSSLIFASHDGYLDIVELLLSKGANINHKNNDGCSSLFFASQKGHCDVVEHLLSKGAKINDKTNDNFTPLMVASETGQYSVVLLLLPLGASIHDRDNNGNTCLQITKSNEIKTLIQNWYVTMATTMLEDLQVLSGIDPRLFILLRKYME